MSDESSRMVLLAGNSHPQLAKLVSDHLQIPLANAVCYKRPCRLVFAHFTRIFRLEVAKTTSVLHSSGM